MTALGGHINHLYEDLDLRFRDLKTIFKILGHADIDTFEKVDGQNLFVGWNFTEDKLIVARNKGNVKDGGLDHYGLSLKFGDRPEVEALFLEAYETLSKAINLLDYNSKVQIFGSMGNIWFPIEIINPDLPNTIHYDSKFIIFHEYSPMLFGIDGEQISNALPRNLECLEKLIPTINKIEGWEIIKSKKFPLIPIDESIPGAACSKLDELIRSYNITENSTIRTYLSTLLAIDMKKFIAVPEHIRMSVSKSLVKMPGALPIKDLIELGDVSTKKAIKEMIEQEKKIIPKLISPIESIVNKFSCSFLSTIKSEYIQDIEYESMRINKEYERCSSIIQKEENKKHLDLLNLMDSKIGNGNKKITLEGLVFKYTNNKIYKITGAFAQMNQVIAAVRYSDQVRTNNKTNVPLSLFMIAG